MARLGLGSRVSALDPLHILKSASSFLRFRGSWAGRYSYLGGG